MEIGGRQIELKEGEPLIIYFMGDIHEGEANCQHDQLNRGVKEIAQAAKDNKNTLVILMGDLANCIVPSDSRRFNPIEMDRSYSIHDLVDLPKKQTARIKEYLRPISKSVDIILAGNHEEEFIKRHNFNIYKEFCEAYPGAFRMGYVGLYRYTVKIKGDSTSMVLDLALNHGAVKSVEKTFTWFDADINVQGHTHRLYSEPAEIVSLNNAGTDLTKQFKWWGISGCFLKTYVAGNRNYFEPKGAKPSDIGMLKAEVVFQRRRNAGRRSWVKDIKLDRRFIN